MQSEMKLSDSRSRTANQRVSQTRYSDFRGANSHAQLYSRALATFQSTASSRYD